MDKLIITERDRVVVAWLVLLFGALLTAGGLLGVWIQEPLQLPTPLTFGEVWFFFSAPAALVSSGTVVVSALIFCSPITAAWPIWRRLVVIVCFGLLVVAGCCLCGYLATERIADKIV
ncbi:MAG: hypothetical protein KDM81_19010 [Verrucomicrobiae bacterium]|nr:hypothetical protein [Verrucomicrobiae bacterium]